MFFQLSAKTDRSLYPVFLRDFPQHPVKRSSLFPKVVFKSAGRLVRLIVLLLDRPEEFEELHILSLEDIECCLQAVISVFECDLQSMLKKFMSIWDWSRRVLCVKVMESNMSPMK